MLKIIKYILKINWKSVVFNLLLSWTIAWFLITLIIFWVLFDVLLNNTDKVAKLDHHTINFILITICFMTFVMGLSIAALFMFYHRNYVILKQKTIEISKLKKLFNELNVRKGTTNE
jgi:hypothetical protein